MPCFTAAMRLKTQVWVLCSLVRGNANLIALQILDKQDPKHNT